MRARHGKPPIPRRSALDSGFAGLRDPFVMVDHLGDDEGEELLREFGIEVGFLGQPPQPRDLPGSRDSSAGGRPWSALSSPTVSVSLNRSASKWMRAASMLSMLPRSWTRRSCARAGESWSSFTGPV